MSRVALIYTAKTGLLPDHIYARQIAKNLAVKQNLRNGAPQQGILRRLSANFLPTSVICLFLVSFKIPA